MNNKLIKVATLAATMFIGFSSTANEIRGEYAYKCEHNNGEYVGTTNSLFIIALEEQHCLNLGGVFSKSI